VTETEKANKPRKTKSQPPAEQPASSVPEIVIEKPKRGRKPKAQEAPLPTETVKENENTKPKRSRKPKAPADPIPVQPTQ